MSKTCPDCYFQSHSHVGGLEPGKVEVRSGVQRTVGVAESSLSDKVVVQERNDS